MKTTDFDSLRSASGSGAASLNWQSRLGLGALVAALFVACPKVPDPDQLELAPAITSFTASQSEVPVGTTVKLTWSVENATSVKIDELKLGLVSGVSGNSGEVDVAITGDSLYVLTARNLRGVSDTAVVSVRVGAAAGDVLFTALPDTIGAGEPTTLAWSAPGATAVTLTANPGGAVDVMGQAASGSVTVTPSTNTTYTLTAGVRSATTTVTVRPTLVSFSASSLSADAGSTVTLSWNTANATRVQLSAPGRGTLVDEMDAARVASGTFADTLPTEVDPGQLFAYELTVTGAGTTLTDSLVVSINGNPAVLSFTAPKYARASTDGGVISLSWTTREAETVSLAADGVEFYRAPPSALLSGSVQIPVPANDTTYLLTAGHSRGGQVTRSAVLDIVGLPTVTLNAAPASIAPGDPVTLSWVGTEVRNVRIVSPFGGTLFSGSDVADTGAAPGTFTFAGTSVLRIEADNGAGDTTSATATVTVTNGLTLTQAAGAVRSGETISLSWTGGTITGLPHSDVVVRSPSTGFDDISATGTAFTFSSTDDAVADFRPAGFSAPFFDRVVGDRVWVSTNGYLSFGPLNPRNYNEVALPSAKLEAYSIAIDWNDQFSSSARWQVKTAGADKVLIVQWAIGTSKTMQVKLHSTGQLDLEYGTWSGSAGSVGVVGPTGRSGFAITTAPAANLGFTLFGPMTSPVLVPVFEERRLLGTTSLAGQTLTLSHDPGVVVQPSELFVSEAMIAPAPTVGAPGRWFELFNARDTAIDLTGWSLSATDGGSAAPLSGQVPARGVLVVGASVDPALNDDAGVQLALTGLDPGAIDAGSLALTRGGGALSTFAWANPTVGTATVTDFGPYKLSTDASALAAHPQTCPATASFGSQGQLGTPGNPTSCGFGYGWRRLSGGFFDISSTGTVVALSSVDEGFGTVSLTPAPFLFFGAAQSSVRVSSNGFLAFDASGTNSSFTTNSPSATDANGLAVPFGGNLIGDAPGAAVYAQRVGPNVDPAAAAPHWVIQWAKWAHFDNSSDFDDFNFQVKLFDDGTLEYHYGTMLGTSSSHLGAGINSVTWLENPTGTQALVINANSFTPGVSSNTGLRFSPR